VKSFAECESPVESDLGSNTTAPCQTAGVADAQSHFSPLTEAVARFNEVFGYGIALPMMAEDVETMAELAALRGRHDVAEALRSGLTKDMTL
jgi:hypothetical protein